MRELKNDEIETVAGGYWEGEPQEGGDGESGEQDFLKLPIFK